MRSRQREARRSAARQAPKPSPNGANDNEKKKRAATRAKTYGEPVSPPRPAKPGQTVIRFPRECPGEGEAGAALTPRPGGRRARAFPRQGARQDRGRGGPVSQVGRSVSQRPPAPPAEGRPWFRAHAGRSLSQLLAGLLLSFPLTPSPIDILTIISQASFNRFQPRLLTGLGQSGREPQARPTAALLFQEPILNVAAKGISLTDFTLPTAASSSPAPTRGLTSPHAAKRIPKPKSSSFCHSLSSD